MNECERAELPEEERGKIPVKGVILLNLNLFINIYNYPIKSVFLPYLQIRRPGI